MIRRCEGDAVGALALIRQRLNFEPADRGEGLRIVLLIHVSQVHLALGDGQAALAAIAEAATVQAAVELIELVDLFNAETGLEEKTPIAIGIGIATGEMVAGHTGTRRRAAHTCVGDAVNLAARLQAQTKVAKRPILIDATTRAALAAGLAVEAIGAVPLKSMPSAIELYAVPSWHRA